MLHVYLVLGFPALAYLLSLAKKDFLKGKIESIRPCLKMNKRIFSLFIAKTKSFSLLHNSIVQQRL